MTQKFEEHTETFLKRLDVDGPTIDLHALFFRLTLDAFGDIAFGKSLGGLEGQPIDFARAFDRAQVLSAHRIIQKPPWLWKIQRFLGIGEERELKEQLRIMDAFVTELIAQRRQATNLQEQEDLLSKLIRASSDDEKMSPAEQEQALRDMTINFIIAGRDTTACALSWIFYRIATRPDVEKKLLSEIDDVFEGRHVTFDELPRCHYLNAVINETLRLHPSVPYDPKTALAKDVLPCGARVNPGDTVGYSPYSMGRMTRLWGPDAAEWRPERWLSADGDFQRVDPYKFTAFQAGPRICLGVDMAMLEMRIVIAKVLPQFSFTLLNDPMYKMGVVLQMKDPGLQMFVKRRSSRSSDVEK